MFYLESLVLLISSAISLVLLYYNVPTKNIQQLISVLIIAILILLNRFIFPRTKRGITLWVRLTSLFLGALIVQLIVLSTGGFFSPFLILIHMFALGSSFLLNLPSSVVFLLFSLIVLVANIWWSANLMMLFKDDPFSVALYFASFVVIIPLAQLLNSSYYIKDILSRILSEKLNLGQQREESILRGLNELVLVTDKDLKLLSVNQAVEKVIGLSSPQILNQKLLDILPLKCKDGSRPTPQKLSVPQMLSDRSARIMEDFYLDTELEGARTPVTVQARPIADLNDKVSQIVFIIKESQLESIYSTMHADLDAAYKRHQAIFDEFQKVLSQTKFSSLELKAYLLGKIEEDLLIAQELEDHIIKENPGFPDMAEICQKSLKSKEEFAKNLKVSLQFVLPSEETAEAARLSLIQQEIPPKTLSVSDFAVPVDSKWLAILLEKLLDIAILLASGQEKGEVQLLVQKEGTNAVNVVLSVTAISIADQLQNQLLMQYFGELKNSTNLYLGSGLEGVIAQKIATQLKLPLTVKSKQYPQRLVFQLQLLKDRFKNMSSN